MSKEKGDLSAALRNLQLVGLNLLTSNLQVEKLLSPLVGLQYAILYSHISASNNMI